MTDLSKELGEIKRDLLENDAVYASCDASSSFEKATRLLSIIETEIPKFIRDYPASIHGSLAVNPAEIARQVANEIASAIESLTKNEKEKTNG